MFKINKYAIGILIVLGFLLYLFFCSIVVPINFTAVDIGRHVHNGEQLLQGHWDVLYRNYYSFTHAEYPFINHHWLAGVVFYLVQGVWGWDGLGYGYGLMMVVAFGCYYLTARRFTQDAVVILLSTLIFALLVDRREIRPEGFSVLFLGIYFFLLVRPAHQVALSMRSFVVLVLVQLLWVNTHIFFFTGPLLATLILWPERSKFKWMLLVLWGVNVFNPSGLAGALTPLNGMGGFGYNLVENQTIWFMMNRFKNNPFFTYMLIAVLTGLVGLGFWFWRTPRSRWLIGFFYFFLLLASFKAIRICSPMSYVWIVMMAQAIGFIHRGHKIVLGLVSVFLGSILIFPQHPLRPPMGIRPHAGLVPQVNLSAEFVLQHDLKGPIFSNYDIGGYLIYHLHPKYQVFVDNRQEAFPKTFFSDIYIPMQENVQIWQSMLDKYQFQLIYFYRHDLTPWGQSFLIRMVDDPQWAPIFVDNYTIIFARRGGENQGAIERFELPRSLFGVKNN